jgi:hypothetical protein
VRVVHCKKEPFDVYIGRPSPWGNPYSHKSDAAVDVRNLVGSREEAIDAYEYRLRILLEEDREFMIEKFFKPIAGKTLGCWCHPKPCHGEVLIKICKELGLA